MDMLNKKNIVSAIIVIVLIFVIYQLFLKNSFGKKADFNPYDEAYGTGRINSTPTYIYAMNNYGTLDDQLTTAANEGVKYSRLADFNREKYEGVGEYQLNYLNDMANTQGLAEGDIYYDIYGGFLPPVDIAGVITSPADVAPAVSGVPAPVIVAPTPTQAVVVSPVGGSTSTTIPISANSPAPAVVAPAPTVISQPAAKQTSSAPSRFTMF